MHHDIFLGRGKKDSIKKKFGAIPQNLPPGPPLQNLYLRPWLPEFLRLVELTTAKALIPIAYMFKQII